MLIYLAMIDSPSERSRFEILYQKYKGLMYYVARNILQNDADAEDAVHQAFLSVITMDRLPDPEEKRTKSLMAIITERKALDIRRKEIQTVSLEDTALKTEDPMPSDSPLVNAMKRLPEKYREVLVLHYIYGYTSKEIGNLLGMTESGARKLWKRASQALREAIEREERTD